MHSDCRNIEAGVQQGSVLGLWLFLIYINDLPVTISSRCFLFANDCFLLEKVQSPSDCASINHDFTSIPEWSSPGIFKRNLLKFVHFPSRSYVFYIGDRSASIFHSCLRLNFSALHYHLFQKNCCYSPACALCNASTEDVKRYFLYCPRFAALREKLFTSAAHLLENRWHCASDKKKIDWLLNGTSTSDFLINVRLFQLVQSFILLSNRSC